ncbi:uncharacterized protein LOC135208375 [Macrobrachium nipponense]|uniref:uncharacterized protein LOC135208375 n=1 Tax=Macrobrachium nipponense TaxID=159736 RepID=UPI0030C8314B
MRCHLPLTQPMKTKYFSHLTGLVEGAGQEVPFANEPEVEPPARLWVQEQAGEPGPQHLNEDSQVGGRLYHFRHRWRFSNWVQSIVSRGLGWSWIEGPPPPNTFYQEPTQELVDYSQELLQKGAVLRTRNLKFQGRLFSVPKKGTDKRQVILDLSRLSLFICCDKFKMLTISQVRTLLPRGAVTTSIDLTDTYYHVLIARHFHPFLGFKLGKEAFSFKVMPFGLNIAPRIFTKLAESVVQELRSQGIMVVAYLDDWLLWEMDVEKCIKAMEKVMRFLEHLGFKINRGKSRLTPQLRFQWLGIQWDLDSHTLSIPPAKRKEIAKATRQFLRSKQMSRSSQERILGSLQFASVTDVLLEAKLKDINRVWRSKPTPPRCLSLAEDGGLRVQQLGPDAWWELLSR